jgi:hypothetical protein
MDAIDSHQAPGHRECEAPPYDRVSIGMRSVGRERATTFDHQLRHGTHRADDLDLRRCAAAQVTTAARGGIRTRIYSKDGDVVFFFIGESS